MGTIEELKSVRQPLLLMGTTTHAARRDGNVIIHVASGITISVPRVNSPAITAILRIPCKTHAA